MRVFGDREWRGTESVPPLLIWAISVFAQEEASILQREIEKEFVERGVLVFPCVGCDFHDRSLASEI
jgi:hypothetical protein